MNIVYQRSTTQVANTTTCVAYEYRQPTQAFDAAVIELSGRYPETGWVHNTLCEAIVHVIQGSGVAYEKDKEIHLVAGDQLFIAAGEKYALEGVMSLV